ncbi:MAG TPA: hypothetical protein PLL98_10515 [Bacillota bacterium]|nr:hypothetical protein [Bacillota bacterium]HPL53657.1 hypothetical protein [Bacillota bacterium]
MSFLQQLERVKYLDIIIDKDAAEYINKHSKDNSIALYVHSASGG